MTVGSPLKSSLGTEGEYGTIVPVPHDVTNVWDAETAVHNTSKLAQPAKSPPPVEGRACTRWFWTLHANFGTKLLVAIFAAEHLVKGFDHGMITNATGFLWKAYHAEAVNFQMYMAIVSMPWSLKPVFGVVSDTLPIWGYRKAPYIILSSLIGVSCYLLIGLDRATRIPVDVCVKLLMGCSLQGSVCDLLTEAQYSERLTQKPKHGPDLVSFVWLGQTVMALVASLVVGPLLSAGGPHLVFLFCAAPACVVFWPMCWNYFGERCQTPSESRQRRVQMLAVWEVFIPVGAVLFGAIAVTLAGFFVDSKSLRLVVALICLAAVLGSIWFALRPEISRVICFYIIQSAIHVNFSGASFYFYTDTVNEYKDGPHFSMTFFTTVLGTVSAVCSLAGLCLYICIFKHWNYRSLLYLTNTVLCVAYLLDVVQFTRMNTRLGINDHIFVLGSQTVQRVVARIAWMPQVLLMSQLCPRGLEGTMYAILAGSGNFGGAISSFLGAYLLHACGVNPRGNIDDATQLAGLWIPCAISAMLPAVVICFIPFMIPDVNQTGVVLVDDPSSPSVGSPLRRLLPRLKLEAEL